MADSVRGGSIKRERRREGKRERGREGEREKEREKEGGESKHMYTPDQRIHDLTITSGGCLC